MMVCSRYFSNFRSWNGLIILYILEFPVDMYVYSVHGVHLVAGYTIGVGQQVMLD